MCQCYSCFTHTTLSLSLSLCRVEAWHCFSTFLCSVKSSFLLERSSVLPLELYHASPATADRSLLPSCRVQWCLSMAKIRLPTAPLTFTLLHLTKSISICRQSPFWPGFFVFSVEYLPTCWRSRVQPQHCRNITFPPSTSLGWIRRRCNIKSWILKLFRHSHVSFSTIFSFLAIWFTMS